MRPCAEGQTLPLPELRIVNDKKMAKVEFVSATEDANDCPPPDGLPEASVLVFLVFCTVSAVAASSPKHIMSGECLGKEVFGDEGF